MKQVKITTTATVVNTDAQTEQHMTSLEIAELTGKQHKHVMDAVRKMEAAWVKVCGSKFRLTSRTIIQPNGGTRDVPCYSLTKTECLYIATKFNDEARAKLVLRWEQLERQQLGYSRQQLALPSPDEIINEAEKIVAHRLDDVNAEAQDCVTTTQIAQMYNMETSDMISFLRDCEILKPRGHQRLMPEYEDRGLAEFRHCMYYSLKGELKESVYMVWTPKGRDLIQRILMH